MYKQILNASSRPSCKSMRSWFSYSTFAAKDFTLQPFALPGFAAIIHQAKSGCHHMSPGRWWEVLPKGELWWPSTISPMLTPLVLKLTDSAWFNNLLSAAFEAKIATLDRHQFRILYPKNWIFLAVMSTVQNLTKQVQVPLAPNFRAMPTEESTLKQFQNLTRWPPAKLLNAGMLLYNDKGIQTHSGM